GRDPGQEAGVGVAVGVGRLFAEMELPYRDFREDAQALPGVVVEQPPGLGAAAPRGRRLHRQDADGVDLVVGVEARVRSLAAPVALLPRAVRHFSSPRPGAGHLTRSDDAVAEGLALVQARGPAEAA